MFKINSEEELLQLLKIVTEESVKKSKKVLRESKDSAQERYMKSLKASETTYGVELSEQEEDAPEDTETEDTPEDTETEDAPEDTETEEPVKEIDPETFGVSFDSVLKDINTLRAGRSTKDKDIKEQLLGYYDKLNEGERKVLHLFLSQLSKILQGALTASDAQDPSDSPFNAEITFGEAEGEGGGEESPSGGEDEETAEEGEGGEDTSPPIKVNEQQDLREIRKRVKRLMKRY
jgi:hypothetical protein